MSWSDGEYRWGLYSPGGVTPAVKALLIATVGAFVAQVILVWMGVTWVDLVFGLVPPLAVGRLCLWQFVTYLFLHDTQTWLHIVFNMLLLYWFGPGIERLTGARRFVGFYLAAGAFAGLIHSCFALWVGQPRPVVGASGAIMALMVLYATYYPDQLILLFLLVPVKIKHCVMVLIGIDLFATFQSGPHGRVASLAHLGGAAFGYLYSRFGERAGDLVGGWLDKVRFRMECRRAARESDEEAQVDRLLEKISREGMESLSGRERQFLVRASKRRREGR